MNRPPPPPIQLPEGDFKGYIFDCDGTLADSMPAHFRAWRHAFEHHGAKFDFTWDLFYSMAGTGLHDSVRQLNARFGDSLDPEAVVQTQSEMLTEEFQHIRPIEPVAALARELHKRHPVAVASGGGREHVEETLTAAGVRELFDVVVSRDDVSHSKPHPECFLRAAELLGLPPEKCLVFEDSKIGIEAAEAAGMKWVYIQPELYSAGPGL